MSFVAIVVSSILVNNFVLMRFLGICPFLGVSRQLATATGMGAAVVFVMTLASAITWVFHHTLLVPFGLAYLQTVVFILVIASLVQFVEMVIQKTSPALYQALGIYLPIITTNCAILGVALINVRQDYAFLESVVNGLAAGMGFTLAIILFAGVRERLELADTPAALKGVPIALVSAGLMSVAFFGFQNLFRFLFS
ncbi:MAG: electron transport complex subunit RsxA [bacterium]|nr:electron transport complex subunit RsxA [bacterium]